MAFLAEAPEDVRELLRVAAVDEVGGGRGEVAREAHVEGLVPIEREAPAAPFIMKARNAEVEQHEVGRAPPRPGGEELGEPRPDELDPVAEPGEPRPGGLHDVGIGVDADEREPGPALEEGFRVPGLPEGRVDEQAAVGGRNQHLEAFGEEDRLVHDHSTILPPSSSAASLKRPSFSSR